MSIDQVRGVLLYCTLLNFGVLGLWFVMITFARKLVYGLWRRWCPVSDEVFDVMNFAGIGLYKVGILLFNVAPLIAVWLAG